MQAEYRDAVARLLERCREQLGECIVAAALFGSVARGEARHESDIDVLLVVDALPRGPRARRALVRQALDEAEDLIQRTRPHAWFQLVIKTPEEVELGGPLFYDMTLPGEAEVLYDPDGFLGAFLDRLARKMAALGARRRTVSGHPYWDLKPDFRPGDIVDL